jgi:intracellular septation protein
MKFLFDLFPVIVFFVAYKIAGIYIATAVAIAASFLQIGWVWFRHRQVDTMLWISLAVIVVFGGATLLLHNETFIKWKPTVLYWLFAGLLLAATLFFRKNLLRKLLSEKIRLTETGWRLLNLSWIAFFTAMGFANLFVAYRFSTDFWVNFKLFGGIGATLVFVLIQGVLLARHVIEDPAAGARD